MEDEHIKLVILGDVGVGKSGVTIQFIQKIFIDEYDPTIEDYYQKLFNVDDKNCVMNILDTAGGDFSGMRNDYITAGQGAVLMFSLTSRISFDGIAAFYHEIMNTRNNNNPFPMLLLGINVI